MKNVQSRAIAAPSSVVGPLLDELAGPDDTLWPAPAWPRLKLDEGLAPGSRGGHGPIRYRVIDYDPGHRVTLEFDSRIGLSGHHEFAVAPEGPERCRLSHVVSAKTQGRMRVLWPLGVRQLHEALLQDLLDRAELAATGRLDGAPARWSWWVRTLRFGMKRRRRS